jgi:hypothetical protein
VGQPGSARTQSQRLEALEGENVLLRRIVADAPPSRRSRTLQRKWSPARRRDAVASASDGFGIASLSLDAGFSCARTNGRIIGFILSPFEDGDGAARGGV